jgi:hypothetical protein
VKNFKKIEEKNKMIFHHLSKGNNLKKIISFPFNSHSGKLEKNKKSLISILLTIQSAK